MLQKRHRLQLGACVVCFAIGGARGRDFLQALLGFCLAHGNSDDSNGVRRHTTSLHRRASQFS